MPTLRQLVDGKVFESQQVLAYGTSDGVRRAWDSRGRSGSKAHLIGKANAVRGKMIADLTKQNKSLNSENWQNHPLYPKLAELHDQAARAKA